MWAALRGFLGASGWCGHVSDLFVRTLSIGPLISGESQAIDNKSSKREEQHFLGDDEKAWIEYGVDRDAIISNPRFAELCDKLGGRVASEKAGISRTAPRRAVKLGIAVTLGATRSKLQRLAREAREAT